jgi:hypothetical protein
MAAHGHGHGHDHDHDHDHDHGDDHGYPHDPEHTRGRRSTPESYAHVQGGAPVLDIGGDIGAMVATVPHQRVGSELHLRSEHDPPILIHTGVWQRDLGGAATAAAVFAELVAGTYWVLDDDGSPTRRVVVNGGALTTIDLREP